MMKRKSKPLSAEDLDHGADEPELVALTPKGKRAKKHIARWVILGVVLLLLMSIGFLVFVVSQDLGKSFGGNIFGLLGKETLREDANGRTNALIFATSGYQPDGSDHDNGSGILTDSIMVVSVDQETGERFTLSVPRDLYVQYDCGGGRINGVYACAVRKGKTESEAADSLVRKVSEVTGIEIQYVAHIDFTVVKELINRVGGVDITIPHDMADYGCGFKYSKDQVVHMDGELAICFSRARNHHGGYGIPNDFERGKNQQRVLRALQVAALNDGKLLNPTAALKAVDSLGDNLRTNVQTNEIRTALELVQNKAGGEDRGEYAFMDSARKVYLLRDECTVSTAEEACGANGGQMILVPAGTTDWYDYSKIHEYFAGVIAK
ncbi:MAG: LCP family protein [Candidatus Nomurabacteria bacterium]|jgi:LCP family protein required for cell wall assembly|nr:LCP family protein [Candidatus Nomurabacteria bacterium]